MFSSEAKSIYVQVPYPLSERFCSSASEGSLEPMSFGVVVTMDDVERVTDSENDEAYRGKHNRKE